MSFSQRFLVIAVICSLCFPLGTQARGIGDFIEKTILETGLGISAHKDSAADLTFGLDADSPGLAFLDGLGIAAAYKQQISPGSESSYFKRADRWKLKFTICPGDLIADALDLPFSLRVSKGRNITFVRFFANEQEAKSAKSYDLKHLPLTAERAVKMLKPGDFVSMPARLNVIGKVQLSKKLALFKGKIGSHYMASGEFHINVLRMKNKLVRLRIGSVRKKQAGLLTGKLVFGVDLFGLQFGNEKLQSVLNLNLASYKLLRESGELLFFDYVFDLKDVKAREAYDAIVATSKHLKPVSALASILEKRPLHDRYSSDITKADD